MQGRTFIIIWGLFAFALVPFSLYSFLIAKVGHAQHPLLPGKIIIEERAPLEEVKELFKRSNLQAFIYSFKDTINNQTHRGKVMYAPEDILQKHHLPFKYMSTLNQTNVMDFVFVMASGASHFDESKDAIASIQRAFPNHTILYYNLGLSSDQVEDISILCNVKYKPFNLDIYPMASYKSTAAFYSVAKIYTIMDALIRHNGVFWVDTAFRIKKRHVFNRAFDKVVKNGGFTFMSYATHSTFAATHPSMYGFLPTVESMQKNTPQSGTYAILMYKTEKIFDNILWWWFVCSLNSHCIMPTTKIKCDFSNGTMDTYADCHRHDQSASNILASNLYHYNVSRYNVDLKLLGGYELRRGKSGEYKTKRCAG